jgi:uridylate kinase
MGKHGVEGVYSADPRHDSGAKFIPEISHHEAIEQRLQVMDSTALSLCMDNGLPLYVFNIDDERNIDRIVCGGRVGTVVKTGS